MRHRERDTRAFTCAKEHRRGGREIEFFILMISVPLFLIGVLLIAVFVLAHYSGDEPTAKTAPVGVSAPDTTEGEEPRVA